jgi:predicted nucleic acid-binding protein
MIVLDANILIRAVLGDAFGSSSTPTRAQVSASSHLTLPLMTQRNIYLLS